MAHSNSSLNCFAECMAKYEHRYILRTEPKGPPSVHLTFGSMAHDVLAAAGTLRDEADLGLVTDAEYKTVIPSEVLYPDLKAAFNIRSWQHYFTDVIKQTDKYEKALIKQTEQLSGKTAIVQREQRMQMNYIEHGNPDVFTPVVGVIDLLIIAGDYAVIIDYKFSTNRKTQDDFDMDSQLQLYAMFVHKLHGIPLRNIRVGFIDIPKQSFNQPTVLTNGTLSRARSQNCSQEMYAKCVYAVHGDDPKYNVEPGGYYYDCWCEMALNKAAYLSEQELDIDVYNGIIQDLFAAASMIDYMTENKMQFLRKYSSYSCKGCEYLYACKPWLTVWEE